MKPRAGGGAVTNQLKFNPMDSAAVIARPRVDHTGSSAKNSDRDLRQPYGSRRVLSGKTEYPLTFEFAFAAEGDTTVKPT